MGQPAPLEARDVNEPPKPLTAGTRNFDPTIESTWGPRAAGQGGRPVVADSARPVLTAGSLHFGNTPYEMADILPHGTLQRGDGKDKPKGRDDLEARLYSIFNDNPSGEPGGKAFDKVSKNFVGARIGTDASGTVRGIERSDRSSVQIEGEGKAATINERDKDGKIVQSWHQKEGSDPTKPVWVNNENPPKERTNFNLEKNGNTTWEAGGERHIVRGNGTELKENASKPNYYFDDQGRYQWIAYPDGNNLFGFSYKGNTENIAAIHTHDRSRNQTRSFVPDTSWGDPKLASDGTYSQTTKEQHGGKTTSLAHVYRPDGTETHESVGPNGAIAVRDEQNRIVATRPPREQVAVRPPGDQAAPRPTTPTEKPKDKDEAEGDAIGPRRTRREQRENNEEIKAERKRLDSGILSKESEDVAHARAELQLELRRIGLKESVTKPILDTFEHTVSVDRERDKRLKGNLPEATTLAERLDLKHHDPDAVPSNERVADTYRIAAEALRQPGRGLFADNDNKAKIIIEGLRNVSDVTGIDQGQRPTCGPTSGEKYVGQRRPDLYMDALKQLVGTGQYTLAYGNAFNYNTLQWNSGPDQARAVRPNLNPRDEEKDWDVSREGNPNAVGNIFRKPQYGSRNWASQAIQEICLESAKRSFAEGKLQDGLANGTTFRHIEDFTYRMTGTPMSTINARDVYGRSMPSAANIRSPLTEDIAMQMQSAGRYPALDWESAHWLTVDAADKAPGSDQVVVYSDNQWGRQADDGWTSVNNRHAKVIAQLRRMGYMR